MKHSIEVGLSFGLTSGTITTLGMIVGLHAGTHSRAVVMGAILLIAVADAMADALGIHVAEETEKVHSSREIWESTFATFFSKFFFALTFAVPLLVLPLGAAVVACVIWGMIVIGVSSILLARRRKVRPLTVVVEHLATAGVVIIVTRLIGDWVGKLQ
jgi:VIT1/CCC1 family predicted Fe2+/Mn2+ transporter